MSKDKLEINAPHGSIRVTGDALTGLVVAAAERIDGARVRRQRRGLDISVSDTAIEVELAIAAPYDIVLPELARAVQSGVAAALSTSTGLAAQVDVAVEELYR